jgi:hypothetical protein
MISRNSRKKEFGRTWDNQYSIGKVEEAAKRGFKSGMIGRRAHKTRATNPKLNEEAIMAEIEANIRKKVKVYLTKQKRSSSYNNNKRQKKKKVKKKEQN